MSETFTVVDKFTHDDVIFDLSVTYVDVIGVEWSWTGGWSADGEPLMRTPGVTVPAPLPDVYRDHGPLIPVHPRPSAAQLKAAVDVDPDYAATVAAGYDEPLAVFEARIAPAPAATPAPVPAGSVFTSPLNQRGFRAFIRTLKGARNA